MSSCNVTCVKLDDTTDRSNWPQLTPNPDIAGVGVWLSTLVLVGFLATAYLTLTIVGIYYIVGYVPEDFLNSIDRGIIDTVWRKARSKPAKTWEPTLRTAVLMFSDQQLVTGIALLTSGYAQLGCGLSVYHWQMIVYLSWFSSLTHLTTLTVLRQYFRENPVPRLWRAILMLLMVTMLVIALLPSGDFWWLGGILWSPRDVSSADVAGLPALCYFKRLVARSPEERFESDAYQTASMLISVMVLFSGYLTRLIKLSSKATALTKLWIRTKPGRLLKKTLNDSIQRAGRPNASKYWRLKHLILETAYVLLRACFDIYESTLWEILWLAFALGWGTAHLVYTRSLVSEAELEQDPSEENTWGFGQVFPVLLLALPILSIGESYYEKSRTISIESRHDAHGAQSNAEHGPCHDTRRRPFLRIGQWPALTTSALAGPFIALESHIEIRRIGIDLQNEEANIGTIRSRIEAAGVSHPHDTPSAKNSVQPKENGLNLSHHYYQFEWFRVLIGMVLLVVSEVIIFGLVVVRSILNVVGLWYNFLISMAFGLFSLLVYTSIFVVLMEYHEAIEKFLDKYAHLWPGLQHICLRVSAYLYAFGVLGVTGYLNYVF